MVMDAHDLPPRLQKLDAAFKGAVHRNPMVEYRGILVGPSGTFAVLLSRPGEEKAQIAMSSDKQRRRLGNYKYAVGLIREFEERDGQS